MLAGNADYVIFHAAMSHKDYTLILNKDLRVIKVIHGKFWDHTPGIISENGRLFGFNWSTLSKQCNGANDYYNMVWDHTGSWEKTVVLGQGDNNRVRINAFDRCGNKIFRNDIIGYPEIGERSGVIFSDSQNICFYIIKPNYNEDIYDLMTENGLVIHNCRYISDKEFIIPNRSDSLYRRCDILVNLGSHAITPMKYIYKDGSENYISSGKLYSMLTRR